MESKEFALFIAEALAEKKAEDLVILEVTQVVGYTDFVVVAGARNARQLQAMIGYVERHVRDTLGRQAYGVEGLGEGAWALIDFGDVVVHVFRNEERQFYDLEGLWTEAPRVPFDPDAVPAAAT
ncbi:MAG: ribosome silencing factor [Myxococcales bacterium]|nr:ribosome silencing factor [Myxococcales bacterium]MCB9545896.1 ribosome silencing factor [Myxococcales bacterium]